MKQGFRKNLWLNITLIVIAVYFLVGLLQSIQMFNNLRSNYAITVGEITEIIYVRTNRTVRYRFIVDEKTYVGEHGFSMEYANVKDSSLYIVSFELGNPNNNHLHHLYQGTSGFGEKINELNEKIILNWDFLRYIPLP